MSFYDKFKKVVKSISQPVSSVIVSRNNAWNELKLKTTRNIQANVAVEKINKKVSEIKIEENNINHLNKKKKMAVFNYGVGGNEVKVDANEAIQEIQGNKSLLVAQLTTDEAISPEIVTGLKTVEDVFNYYSPSIEVEHETHDGQTVKEEFAFKNLGDFTPKNMVENSEFLKGLKLDEEQYNKIVRQLRVNKVLRKMFEDKEAKQEFADTLRAIAKELEK